MRFQFRFLAAFWLIFLPLAVHADAARPIDFTAVLVGLDGKPLPAAGGEKDAALTLGDVAATALTIAYPNEQAGGEEKVKRWQLALKVRAAKSAELTVDEVKLIKDLVAKAYGPMVVGQAWAILDPASVK